MSGTLLQDACSPFFARRLLVRTGLAAYSAEAKARTGGQPQFVKDLSDRTLAAPLDGDRPRWVAVIGWTYFSDSSRGSRRDGPFNTSL